MNYNATCGFEPVPYTIKVALMGSSLLLAAVSLFLCSAPKISDMSDAAKHLQVQFGLQPPPARGAAGCQCCTSLTCAAGLGPVCQRLPSMFFIVYPFLKIAWVATTIVTYVWGSKMSYLCGVAFVHDMDIVGCNVALYAAFTRLIVDLRSISKKSADPRGGGSLSWPVLPLACAAFLTLLASFYFLAASVIYTVFSVLASLLYIWCTIGMCILLCCLSARAPGRRYDSASAVSRSAAGAANGDGAEMTTTPRPLHESSGDLISLEVGLPVVVQAPPRPQRLGSEAQYSMGHHRVPSHDVQQDVQAGQPDSELAAFGSMSPGAASADSEADNAFAATMKRQNALPYFIFQPETRAFSAKDKLKLLLHYALLQLNWLVPALLVGPCVQYFAGAGYIDAIGADWNQRYVMAYINSSIDGLKDHLLSQSAMAILSYIL